MEFLKIICLLFIIVLSDSNNVYSFELSVASLLEGNQSSTSIDSCFDSNGEFDEVKCARVEKDCSFEQRFSSFNAVPISLEMRDDFFRYKSQGHGFTLHSYIDNDVDRLYANESSNHSVYSAKTIKLDRKLFPVDSLATIYESKSNEGKKTVSIYNQFKVTDGLLKNVYPIPAIHKLKISFPDITDQDGHLTLMIFNEHYFKYQGPKEFEYTLSEGTYSFKAILRQTNQTRELKFKYKISKDPNFVNGASNKILSFKKSQFTILPPYNPKEKVSHQLIWRTEEYPSTKKIPKMGLITQGDLTKSIYFKEIKGFKFVEDGNKELKDMIIIEKGMPSVQQDKIQTFLNIINQKPFHTLKVNGICYSTEKKPKIKEFNLFAKPDDKSSNLGKIIVEVTPDGNDASVFFKNDPNLTPQKYDVNLISGSCRGESAAQVLHVVKEVKDEWVNMGKGPWGTSGWLKANYSALADGSGRYELNGLNNVTFSKGKGDLIKVSGDDFSRSENDRYEPGDESPEIKVEYSIEPERLFTKDGRFIPNIDCSYGC